MMMAANMLMSRTMTRAMTTATAQRMSISCHADSRSSLTCDTTSLPSKYDTVCPAELVDMHRERIDTYLQWQRERERVCVCVRVRACVCVCLCVCVCVLSICQLHAGTNVVEEVVGQPDASMLKSESPTRLSSPSRNAYGASLTQYSDAENVVLAVGQAETHRRSASPLLTL